MRILTVEENVRNNPNNRKAKGQTQLILSDGRSVGNQPKLCSNCQNVQSYSIVPKEGVKIGEHTYVYLSSGQIWSGKTAGRKSIHHRLRIMRGQYGKAYAYVIYFTKCVFKTY